MVTLYPVKLINIITNDSMEERLVAMFKKYGVSGYTILRVGGEGSSGLQSEMTGFDSNILVKVILPPERMEPILESLERKLRKGYHLTVYIVDVQVITPGKFVKPLR
jgi:nitrogen regulatory protein PII